MSTPCNIKDSSQAWNDGVIAFKNAMNLTSDASKSIRYALKEINRKHPDLNFSHESFINPIIEKLKEAELVYANYEYKTNKLSEVEKIVNQFKDLDNNQAKELSKKIFEKSFKTGMANVQDIKNAYAQVKGYPSITPEFNKLIDVVATDRQNYQAIKDQQKQIFKDIQAEKKESTYTDKKDKEYSDKLKELNKQEIEALKRYVDSDLKFGEMLSHDRHFVYQFGDIMKMNLMSPVSIAKNTTGMLGDAVFRNMSNLVAAPISFTVMAARKAMGKTNSTLLSPSLISRTVGSFKGNASAKAAIFLKTGSEPVFSDKIRRPNYADGIRNIRKIQEGDSKFINSAAFVFKISPTLITRGLGSPDFLFQEMAETAELNRIGNEKGYKGAELQAFLSAPDESSLETAKEHAKKVTYKQALPMEEFFKNNLDFAKMGDAMIERGMSPWAARLITGAGHVLKNIIMPFTTTPINILRSANKIILPEYTFVKGMIQANKLSGDEKTNKIISTIADATVGFHIRMIALNLVSKGLISAGYDDEEDKVREVVEKKTGGPNKVNINAIWRGFTFQDINEKKNDRYVDINSLGTLGIAFGAYAHAYNKYGQKDLEKEIDYLKNGNYFSIPANTGLSQLSSAMDFTFFSGWNESFKALKGEGNDREKWLQNSLMTVIGGFMPSTHQILSKSETESRPKTYDKDLSFSQNVYNQMGYRFFFQVPDKTFKVLTEHGEKPERIKEHYMFDNYWGRVLAATDPFKSKSVENPNSPSAKLYNTMQEVDKKERDNLVPGFISDKIKVNGQEVKLEKNQYNYFQQQASMHRMILATPFIMSQDYNKLGYDEKCKVLQSLYTEGREQALSELKEKYPNLNTSEDYEKPESDETLEEIKEKYKPEEE